MQQSKQMRLVVKGGESMAGHSSAWDIQALAHFFMFGWVVHGRSRHHWLLQRASGAIYRFDQDPKPLVRRLSEHVCSHHCYVCHRSCCRARTTVPAMILAFVCSNVIYDPIACWTWSPSDWAYKLGVLDSAEATAVHIRSNLIPGLQIRASQENEIAGIDDAEIGVLEYDYVEQSRDVVMELDTAADQYL